MMWEERVTDLTETEKNILGRYFGMGKGSEIISHPPHHTIGLHRHRVRPHEREHARLFWRLVAAPFRGAPVMILSETHKAELDMIRLSEFMGGAAPTEYRQWRRLEAMRKARLLKFYDRRRPRWDLTFYQITERGKLALSSNQSK
jgi:hypothetical protein